MIKTQGQSTQSVFVRILQCVNAHLQVIHRYIKAGKENLPLPVVVSGDLHVPRHQPSVGINHIQHALGKVFVTLLPQLG